MTDARVQERAWPRSRQASLRELLETRWKFSVADALRVGVELTARLQPSPEGGVACPVPGPEDVLVDVQAERIISVQLIPPGGEKGRSPDRDGEGRAGSGLRSGVEDAQVAGVRAVGGLLLEMLTGEPLAMGAKSGARLPDLRHVRSDVPEDLALLVYRMLDDDPDLRPQSLESVAVELQRILSTLDGAYEAAASAVTVPPRSASAAGDAVLRLGGDQDLLFSATSFVGREQEMAQLKGLLTDPQCRLVTLVGPGGIGKSRLAFHVAQDASASFRDGVYFVPLSAVRSPTFISLAIGNAMELGFSGPRDPRDQLIGYLQEKHVLLVLDDFDQLLEGGALVKELLERTEDLRVVVTSRERLNLRIERLFEVTGLEVPEEGCVHTPLESGSVRLFSDTAAQVASDFRLEAEQAHVVRICRLLEGMPLGIELAAGWTRVLGCKDIADEIGRDVGFLTSSQPDVPERHRGIRATFDRSWALLTEEQRQVLARLSVFSGGFRREAAEAVTGATLQLLSAFVDKSLVRPDAFGRYRIHELLRQYLNERLEECPEHLVTTADRHCSWHAEFVEARQLGGWAGSKEAGKIEEEFGNIQKAWDWAVENLRLSYVKRMVAPLFAFYKARGWYVAAEDALGVAAQRVRAAIRGEHSKPEARAVLGSILVRQATCRFDLGDCRGCEALLKEARNAIDEGTQPGERALALRTQSNAAVRQGRYEEAQRLLGEVRRIGIETHDRGVEGDALQDLGNVAMHLARYSEAERLTTEALQIRRELGHPRGMAVCLNTLGNIAYNSGRHADAQRYYEESLQIARNLGNRMGESALLANLGNIAGISGDDQKAKVLCTESLDIAREIGFHRGVSHGLYLLGGVCIALGDYDGAEAHLRESLALHEKSGDRRGAAYSLMDLGRVWCERGDYQQAQKLQSRALAIFRELDVPLGVARALSRLGDTVLASGDADQAQDHYAEGLRIASGIGAATAALWGVLGWARSCKARKNPRRAAELCAFVASREASCEALRGEASDLLIEVASELAPEEFEAARAAGRSRTLENLVEELLGGAEAATTG